MHALQPMAHERTGKSAENRKFAGLHALHHRDPRLPADP
jgi:hypothetical protein